MLVEALGYVFEKLLEDEVDLSAVNAVKVDGMQHCTVYVNKLFKDIAGKLNPKKELIGQLKSAISRDTIPIWEDRSTVKEASLLAELLKDKGGINKLTGNRAELRFPALQIMKLAKESPVEYKNTKNIFLLSAFMTSVLSGKIAPVDTGDGWGTNLNSTNIKKPSWNKDVLDAVDSYLKGLGINESLGAKIGSITDYDVSCGRINDYFVKRYGINQKAVVLAGTGDNPATLLGCGGEIVISLGSSYTVNGVMPDIAPSQTGEYNVFGYTKGKAMALCCITNGAKVHDYFLKKYVTGETKEPAREDWEKYTGLAGRNILTQDEKLMLPYLLDESVPLCIKGVVRENFSENDVSANIRALHVSQVLSLKIHSSHLSKIDKICIVGGSSKNIFLRQAISDVFNAKSYSIKNSDYAAPLGCAISGAKQILGITYGQACERFVQKDEGTFLKPGNNDYRVVKTLLERYENLEKSYH